MTYTIPRYHVVVMHGERATVFHVVDSAQPLDEQPCVVHSWRSDTEPNARYLADDFCARHNAKAPPNDGGVSK